MDALVMCGGRGTRLAADVEKPLFEIGGRPMVDRVLDALAASRVDAVRAVVSPHVPETREHVECPLVETPGEGYVPDLDRALDEVAKPVLTVVTDLPLLSGEAVDAVLDAHREARHDAPEAVSTAVCVPTALKRALGLSVDAAFDHEGRELSPAGINVVDEGDDDFSISHDARLAVNVNRRGDADVAEGLL